MLFFYLPKSSLVIFINTFNSTNNNYYYNSGTTTRGTKTINNTLEKSKGDTINQSTEI